MDDCCVFFLMIRRPPRSPLFPYTPLSLSLGFFAVRIPLAYLLTRARLDLGPLGVWPGPDLGLTGAWLDRKSTRLNSSHANISYAVFCLKKKIMPLSSELGCTHGLMQPCIM